MAVERSPNRKKKVDRRQQRVDRGEREIKEKFMEERELKAQPIVGKTENQKLFLKSVSTNTITVGRGASGVGKTWLSACTAANKYLKGEVDRIVLVRPYVQMGRSSGFWPGTIEQRLEPYFLPMISVLKERLGEAHFNSLYGKQIVIQPMEAVRGMDFKNTLLICDECFEEGSEILTLSGFKDFRDLTEKDLVAQYTAEGDIEFVLPERIISKYYSGNMHKVESDQFYSCVTENHRRVFKDKNNDLVIKTAKEGVRWDFKWIRNGLVSNQTFKDFDIKWIQLAIALQADGNLNIKKRTKHKAWFISVSRERKIERIKYLMDSLGIKYSSYYEEHKNGYRFYLGDLTNTPISEILLDNKTFNPEFFLSLDLTTMTTCVDELFKWDGSVKGGVEVYCTTNKQNAELAQAMISITGNISNICKTEDNRKESYKDYYRVYKQKTKYTTMQKKEDCIYHYEGMVYCVTVPSGMVVVRQNGYVQVSGNCQNVTKSEMRCLLTRISEGSQFIFIGDDRQADIQQKQSGLLYLVDLLNKHGIESTGVIEFSTDDVVRHDIVAKFVRIFDEEGSL